MTVLASTPTYHALSGGVWSRKGHASITPGSNPNQPFGYDWTANPYGSLYDARAAGQRAAGGYVPHIASNNCGIPTGVTMDTTIADASGYLTLSSARTVKGGCTISAATNKVTLANHGLSNGHPVFFDSLTGGTGLALFTAAPHLNWYAVANATTNDFTLKRFDIVTRAWVDVDITAAYTAATLVAGTWYDKTDFTCYITTTTTATGLCLISRSKPRGPAAGLTGAQGLVYNKPTSNLVFIVVDSEMTPDAPIAELNSFFGPNNWSFRIHSSHVTDGFGSLGGNHHYGGHWEKGAWFRPNPNHTDGSHCDTFGQVHYGDSHTGSGNNGDGYIDSSVSSTNDATNFPIPTRSTSCLLVGAAAPIPTGLDFVDNDLGGGALAINVAAANFPNLGDGIKRNLIHLADSEKCTFVQGIEAPPSGSGLTIHCNIPSSGTDANRDETGAVLVPYVAPGNTLVWP